MFYEEYRIQTKNYEQDYSNPQKVAPSLIFQTSMLLISMKSYKQLAFISIS